jgi:hypothetical protein
MKRETRSPSGIVSGSGANHTIVCYNADVVKIYEATISQPSLVYKNILQLKMLYPSTTLALCAHM